MARSVSATDMIPLPQAGVGRTARCTAAISAPRGACFPARLEPFIDLSTGINPYPYPLPRFPAGLVRAAAGAGGRRGARRDRRASLWRAVGGPCRAGAGHADLAAARRRAGAAGPRRSSRADLCRTCPRRGACRASASRRSASSTHCGDADARHRRQSEQSRRQALRAQTTCSRSPTRSAPTRRPARRRRSLHGCRPAGRKPCAGCRRAAMSSCCARSANFLVSPACGLALRLPRRRSAARHRRRTRSMGGLRTGTRCRRAGARRHGLGSSAHARGSTSRRNGSTPCWPIWRCRLSAARACFGWCKRRPRTRSSSIWAGPEFGCAPFADNAKWLRFGLPGNEAAWKRLKAALVAFW